MRLPINIHLREHLQLFPLSANPLFLSSLAQEEEKEEEEEDRIGKKKLYSVLCAFYSAIEDPDRDCVPLRDTGSGLFMPSLGSRRSEENCDMFIPNKSAMDFGIAYYLLTEPRKTMKDPDAISQSKDAYRNALTEVLLQNRTQILSFRSRPSLPSRGIFEEIISSPQIKSVKQ